MYAWLLAHFPLDIEIPEGHLAISESKDQRGASERPFALDIEIDNAGLTSRDRRSCLARYECQAGASPRVGGSLLRERLFGMVHWRANMGILRRLGGIYPCQQLLQPRMAPERRHV